MNIIFQLKYKYLWHTKANAQKVHWLFIWAKFGFNRYKVKIYGKNMNIPNGNQSPYFGRKGYGSIMNNEQTKETRKLPGFYIAVCCCVLAIGAAGYFTQRKDAVKTNVTVDNAEDTELFTNAPETAIPTKMPLSETEESLPSLTETESIPYTEAASASSVKADDYTADNPDLEASVTVSAEENVIFQKPANGEVLANFSDKPIYNEALDDWRTHNGIDIAVNEGGSICAAADGVVSKIDYDVMGCSVTIDHADGYTTKYMQLESATEVQEGTEVKKGDVIGVVGKSTAENAREPHIHFEMYKDGEVVDPAEAIK